MSASSGLNDLGWIAATAALSGLAGVGRGFGDGGRPDGGFVGGRLRGEGTHTLTCHRLPCASSEAVSAGMGVSGVHKASFKPLPVPD
jgi:hypothetical protein